MREFTVGEFTYRSRKMSAMDQARVAKRIAPMLSDAIVGLLPLVVEKVGAGGHIADMLSMPVEELAKVIVPLTKALSQLSDADHDLVLAKAMSVVERRQPNGHWAPIWNEAAGMSMFEDINKSYATQLKIVGPALWENLSDFFSELLSGLTAA